jgi:osmotically-inducible protein OsmY
MSQDDQLRDAVIAELAWEPSIVTAHIGVAADHGVITLTGHVDSFVQKYAPNQPPVASTASRL